MWGQNTHYVNVVTIYQVKKEQNCNHLKQIVQFHEVREIDEGFYRCQAVNRAGAVYSEIVQIDTGKDSYNISKNECNQLNKTFKANVSVASVVGIVFGVIFGVAFVLVIGIMVFKRIKGNFLIFCNFDSGSKGIKTFFRSHFPF